jgi:hypothetical protein
MNAPVSIGPLWSICTAPTVSEPLLPPNSPWNVPFEVVTERDSLPPAAQPPLPSSTRPTRAVRSPEGLLAVQMKLGELAGFEAAQVIWRRPAPCGLRARTIDHGVLILPRIIGDIRQRPAGRQHTEALRRRRGGHFIAAPAGLALGPPQAASPSVEPAQMARHFRKSHLPDPPNACAGAHGQPRKRRPGTTSWCRQ